MTSSKVKRRRLKCAPALREFIAISPLCLLSACGGSSSGNSTDGRATTHAVTVTVSGLTGSGLVFQLNGGSPLAVATNGPATFSTPLASGIAYAVIVGTQPSSPTQVCTVSNGTGTVADTNVTGIAVNCVTSSFTIGFSVQSLVGSGLVLQLNDGTDLTVSATSPTAFATPLLSGANYAVTVKTQPSSPNQICDVTGGSGVVSSANVTNVVVTCAFGTWTWVGGSQNVQQPGTYGNRGTPSASNIPTARQWATSWTDHSGHFWLFGGNDQGGGGMLNDLWTYDPAAGLWTWVSGSSGFDASSVYGSQNVAAPGNVPGARQQSASWTDAAGNLWLFGGRSYAGSSGNTSEPLFNDLWKFSAATGQWTWMGGSNVPGATSVYGTQGVAAAGNVPGARYSAATWTDSSGNLWLFGGNIGSGQVNGLWMYNPSSGFWTWVGGTDAPFLATAVYGTKGVAAASNIPGGREGAAYQIDSNNNFWLFGGTGTGSNTNFNDLWKYSPAEGEWTWVSGDSTPLTAMGVFGTQGVPSATTVPVPVSNASSWIDSSGNFWLFGGYVCGFTQANLLNDADLNVLWKYDTSTNQWTWVSGSELLSTNNYPNGCGAVSAYGTLGTPSTNNGPGGRASTSSWIDTSGNLWFFGGTTFYDINPEETIGGQMNDLWKFTPLQ